LSEEDPDELLLARVGQQDPAAIREMVTRKLPRLLALASRMLGHRGDAEDVAQEAILRLWKQAAHWRSGSAKVDTWLHRVALNLCYDRLRRRIEVPVDAAPEQADAAPEPVDAAPTPEESMQARAQSRHVAAALAALPARQREALILQYYQDFPSSEAAALMGLTVAALESLLARARRNLRAIFDADSKDWRNRDA
jgi:RNA polymerase sigma-70 factor (ECF subfamily)